MPQSVLIVNGDRDTREILRVLLRHHGYATREVQTVEDAVAVAAADPPDLIAGEMWVPAASGVCCLPERIRADLPSCTTRILVLTSDAFEGVQQRAKAAGADGLLTKPVELPTLVGEIRRLIGPGIAPPSMIEGRRDQESLGT